MLKNLKIDKSNWIDHAWLGLGDISKLEYDNPMFGRSSEDIDRPGRHEARLMRDPQYLAFAAKVLLDIQLLPMQAVILEELAKRPFPMYVASRGFGKAISPDELVRIKGGWAKIKDIEVGDKVYGSDGKLANVTGTTILQENLDFYKITLRDGRTIECCKDHRWKIWDKNKNKDKDNIVWSEVKTSELVGNYFNVRKDSKSKIPGKLTKEYRYALPINQPLLDEDRQDFVIHPYVLGVLLGDGSITQHTISLTNNDVELIDRFEQLLPNGYKLTRKKKDNCYICTVVRSCKSVPAFHVLIEHTGLLGCSSHTKFIPEQYKYCAYDQKLELIRGLMDTDGYSKKSVIEYYTVSNRLSTDFLDIARSCGLHCKHAIKESWFRNNRYADCNRISIYTKQPVFSLARKLQYVDHDISKQGQSKYDKVFITNIEYIGKKDGHCITVDNDDHTYITKDYIVTHNSYLLALYAMLKCILYPGTKIVIVGAAFRQSKVIFEYMETMWNNAPVFRSLCDTNTSGPRRDTDRCTMRINDSWAIAVPLGDGTKIRGLRAHIIIADEFNCLESNTIVETTKGLVRIGDTNIDHSKLDIITGDASCPTERMDKYIMTPTPCDVYEVKFKNGYVIRCSENHKLMTQEGWKKPLELCKTDFVEADNKYVFPQESPKDIDEKTAWLLGILISEGSVNDKKRISIKTTNELLACKLMNEFGFKVCTREAHTDRRGWNCKKSYELYKYDETLRDKLFTYGLNYTTAHTKCIPSAILLSNKSCVYAFLEGLFEGDGSCFLYSDKKKIDNRLGVAYYSVSEQLCRDVQIVLNKLGYDGYINKRKSNLSDNQQWFVRLNGFDAYDFASKLNIDRFQNPIKNCYIPVKPLNYTYDKSRDKWKISIKYLDKTIQKRVNTKQQAIRTVSGIRLRTQYKQVVSVTKLEEQQVLYDYHLPQTHSFYAGGFRNHNSIPPDIYETVVAGFAAVSSDPVSNVKEAARRKAMTKMGIWTADAEHKYKQKGGNQAILSGTAGYDFQHFADYWKKYCQIIRTQGDKQKLCDIMGMDDVPDNFDWRDYSVMRIPYEIIPEGFMDDRQVSRARATIHSGLYQMEYGAVFTADSDGFFKRTLIERCVASDTHPVNLPSGPIWFDPKLRGSSAYHYVYGIDPASEQDNFSIVILELHKDHTRIVYSWSTNRKDFKRRLKAGMADKSDFYGFCVRKIRDLMRSFPCEAIALDAQGGGIAIEEGLHDPDKMESGEDYIWPVIDPDKEKDTDIQPGKHILHLCQFAKSDWTSEANHGLRKDFEDRVLLLPRFDPVSLELSAHDDKLRQQEWEKKHPGQKFNIYDTLEDCVMELEELKDELCTITVTRTGTGVNARDRWDTPEVKLPTGKKGRLRKDRYSSLVMANMIARTIHRTAPEAEYQVIGGRIGDIQHGEEGQMYYGPEWFQDGMDNGIIRSVIKSQW